MTGLVLTKLDGTAKGGIVLAIARKLRLPIRFIGIGEQAGDFGEFDAAAFAAALVEGGRSHSGCAGRRWRMIVFERVTKRYPNGREALRAATFSIDRGEMVFLTGRSGAGKSTVLKLIAMLERPTRGSVVVNGQNLATLKSRQLPAYRRTLGVVFQEHRLLDDRPVFDNVALPLVVSGAGGAENGQARARRARSGGSARQGAHAAE